MVMITFFFFQNFLFYFTDSVSSFLSILLFNDYDYHFSHLLSFVSCRAIAVSFVQRILPFPQETERKKNEKKKIAIFLFSTSFFLPAQKQESTEFHRNKLSQLSPGDYRRRVVDYSLIFLFPLIIWIPLFPLSLFSCMSLFPYLVALILV